jgi:2-keto-4-pentenoate hydratase/2-oxohepta-3-ene-1,7-dioic acid hydratase in catechol pathway
MKLANFDIDGSRTIALVDSEKALYWPARDLLPGFAGDMVDLIRHIAAERAVLKPQGDGLSLHDAVVLAPIDQPRRNIFCVGKNYHEHALEFHQSGFDSSSTGSGHVPEMPVVFTKPASAVIGPGATIPRHARVARQLDYEAELGVVIGRGGIGISRSDATEHVFGYTIINDFTARDLQKSHKQWFIGKSLDGFCPMGPYIVTADEVDGRSIDVKCWVNGELRQNANTRQLIFDIPTLIETLSAGIALQPGDVIATGTPAGVGIGFNPPKFMDSGDVIRIEIERLGVLENVVGQ